MLTFNFVYLLQLCTFQDLICHYFVPVFVFATWLVVTTFLHHQVWFGPRCYQQGPVPLSRVYVQSALCAIRKLFYLEVPQNHIVTVQNVKKIEKKIFNRNAPNGVCGICNYSQSGVDHRGLFAKSRIQTCQNQLQICSGAVSIQIVRKFAMQLSITGYSIVWTGHKRFFLFLNYS